MRPKHWIYTLPFWCYYHLDLHVSVRGNPRSLIEPIRKLCETVDPGVTMDNPRLMSAQTESLLFQERSAAFTLGIFGSLALILAAIGLYGVISYSVTQRTHEFGIRVALGAQDGDILRQVITEGVFLVMIGLAIGLPCSIALSRFVANRMHGLSPLDPITYVAISALLAWQLRFWPLSCPPGGQPAIPWMRFERNDMRLPAADRHAMMRS